MQLIIKIRVILKLNTKYEILHDKIIEMEVANPFKILSAYFTTTAIRIPPNA